VVVWDADAIRAVMPNDFETISHFHHRVHAKRALERSGRALGAKG
jgi:hypothetical protein